MRRRELQRHVRNILNPVNNEQAKHRAFESFQALLSAGYDIERRWKRRSGRGGKHQHWLLEILAVVRAQATGTEDQGWTYFNQGRGEQR